MIKLIQMADLDGVDLVPQAIIRQPISFFAWKFHNFVEDHDDLGMYEGAAFKLDDDLCFAIKRYYGYPADTTTIYLPNDIRTVDEIAVALPRILKELGISQDFLLKWRRMDDPDL